MPSRRGVLLSFAFRAALLSKVTAGGNSKRTAGATTANKNVRRRVAGAQAAKVVKAMAQDQNYDARIKATVSGPRTTNPPGPPPQAAGVESQSAGPPPPPPPPHDCILISKQTPHLPEFTACLHPAEADIWISNTMRGEGLHKPSDWWQAADTFFYLAYLKHRPGGVVDVGANLGSVALPLGRLLQEGRLSAPVLAVEPGPANAFLLRKGVEKSGLASKVRVHECAVVWHDKKEAGKEEMAKPDPPKQRRVLWTRADAANNQGHERIPLEALRIARGEGDGDGDSRHVEGGRSGHVNEVESEVNVCEGGIDGLVRELLKQQPQPPGAGTTSTSTSTTTTSAASRSAAANARRSGRNRRVMFFPDGDLYDGRVLVDETDLPENSSLVRYLHEDGAHVAVEEADADDDETKLAGRAGEDDEAITISLLKIDCEGCEGHAVVSAREVIEKQRPLVAVEWTEHWLNRSGITGKELRKLFRELNYAGFAWNNRELLPIKVALPQLRAVVQQARERIKMAEAAASVGAGGGAEEVLFEDSEALLLDEEAPEDATLQTTFFFFPRERKEELAIMKKVAKRVRAYGDDIARVAEEMKLMTWRDELSKRQSSRTDCLLTRGHRKDRN